MSGKEIAELICQWATKKKLHNDDFNDLFVHELLERLEEDNDPTDV